MTFDEFRRMYNVSEGTIRKRARKGEIPGMNCILNEYQIMSGTRYPYNVRGTRIKKYSDRVYIILKATSENYYVDEKMLKISKNQFDLIINELLANGLLIKNNEENPYGSNPYDVTGDGERIKNKKEMGGY